ncbi:hypothetical protein BDD12DRAFT_869094, partial [Trichophaea hybrida]
MSSRFQWYLSTCRPKYKSIVVVDAHNAFLQICTEVGTFPEVVLVVATVVTWRNISLRQLHGILTRRRLDNFLTTRCRRDDFLTVRRSRLLTVRLHGLRLSLRLPGLWTVQWCRLTSARYSGLGSVRFGRLLTMIRLRVVVPTDCLLSWRLDTYNTQPY